MMFFFVFFFFVDGNEVNGGDPRRPISEKEINNSGNKFNGLSKLLHEKVLILGYTCTQGSFIGRW